MKKQIPFSEVKDKYVEFFNKFGFKPIIENLEVIPLDEKANNAWKELDDLVKSKDIIKYSEDIIFLIGSGMVTGFYDYIKGNIRIENIEMAMISYERAQKHLLSLNFIKKEQLIDLDRFIYE